MCVSRIIEFEPELPDDLLPLETRRLRYRRGTLSQARDAADQGPASWPWFPLRTDGARSRRVIYALAPPDSRNTIIRIQEFEQEPASIAERNARLGPERWYPGALVLPGDGLPDFNKDGYTDLVLWRSPEPGTSVDSLTRILMQGIWPVDLTTHLFSVEKRRYEPVPSARVKCNAPVLWFLTSGSGVPLRHCVLRDFDGDGRTDLGCSTAPGIYSVWLYGKRGFGADPDHTQVVAGPLVAIDFCGDLETRGRTSLALRTEKALYVLRATAAR